MTILEIAWKEALHFKELHIAINMSGFLKYTICLLGKMCDFSYRFFLIKKHI